VPTQLVGSPWDLSIEVEPLPYASRNALAMAIEGDPTPRGEDMMFNRCTMLP
jgi:hypothetical protein